MEFRIQVFAGLADLMGGPVITVNIPANALTAEQLKQRLAEQYPGAASLLRQSFFAVNQAYAAPHDSITPEDEIALIPPVSGGEPAEPAGSSHDPAKERFVITFDRIHADEVTQKVIHPNHGAALAFVGTTREYTQGKRTVLLEYEAYVPMALKTMRQIGDEISERWPGALCAITHRLGKVAVGEASVVIAVSSAHRAECYEASRFAIERLKQIVPIWKKEVWEDGSEWKGHQQGPWNPTVPL
jgi:molybdopterin synthase catalytic subunit